MDESLHRAPVSRVTTHRPRAGCTVRAGPGGMDDDRGVCHGEDDVKQEV
jgi:hypothetical protein